MEIRVLKYFLMVAREENITRASQLLHVTQPTLSRQLMQLEDELGVKLFQRGSHRIVLTEDGMLLRRRAQEIVDLADRTARDFARGQGELSGEINLGGGETRSMALISQMIAALLKEHPRVRCKLFSGNADSIKERIESGLLDLGLLVEPVDISRYEFIRLPVREERGVLVRADSPLAGRPFVTPQDLIGEPLMLSDRTPVQNELMNWFGDEAGHVNVVTTYNLLYNAAMMVRAGVGIALCIRLDCEYDELRFLPLSPPLDMHSVLVWKKSHVFSPAVAAFLEHVRTCLKSMKDNPI